MLHTLFILKAILKIVSIIKVIQTDITANKIKMYYILICVVLDIASFW